jgi:hypothetical protein
MGSRTYSSIAAMLAAVAFGVAGCAPQEAIIKGFHDEPTGITVVDKRPNPEKSEWLSQWVGSCDTGIRRLGDEVTIPSRIAILQRDLRLGLGGQYAGASLAVSKYSIFFNMSQVMQKSNPAAGGLIGALLIASGCTKEKTTDGWYDPQETTNFNSPIVVEIETKLEQKPYSARAVYSPPTDISAAFGGKDESAALFAAIAKAHASLVEQIKKN